MNGLAGKKEPYQMAWVKIKIISARTEQAG